MHDFRSGECWRQTDAGEGLLEMIARALPDPASGQLAAMQVVRGEAAKSISALLVFGVFF
jgi:hypothetical protein